MNKNSSVYKTMLHALLALSVIVSGCKSHSKNYHETPGNPVEQLQAGNRRFAQHHARHPHQSSARIAETANGQKPFAAVVTCSDSRVSPEIIFDEGIGDLFVIRNAGNIVDEEDVLASIEYAVAHLGIKVVVVMGHERCGAIEAMTHGTFDNEPEHIAAILQHLKNEPEEQEALGSTDTGEQLVHRCVVANVEYGVAALNRQLQHLQGHGSATSVTVVGAVYDVRTGIVHFQEVKPSSH